MLLLLRTSQRIRCIQMTSAVLLLLHRICLGRARLTHCVYNGKHRHASIKQQAEGCCEGCGGLHCVQLPDFASISSLLTLHKADIAVFRLYSIYAVLTLAFAKLRTGRTRASKAACRKPHLRHAIILSLYKNALRGPCPNRQCPYSLPQQRQRC